MYVSKAISASFMLEGQVFVVDPHQVKQGSLEVMNVNRVSDDVVTKIIGFTVSCAGFDASAGHPD